MGKKRIVTTDDKEGPEVVKKAKGARKRVEIGVVHIQSTYNNTKMLLTDTGGNALAWSSSGSLGFKGAKKGTPFAASKLGELLADKATLIGIKDVSVTINGVGAGREAALRAFTSKGIGILSIGDVTPVPHNGPRSPRARRV
ncbi:MAG TPA: 30S ribosomal protein S11 [Candidatus Paceibacterota bacterium]